MAGGSGLLPPGLDDSSAVRGPQAPTKNNKYLEQASYECHKQPQKYNKYLEAGPRGDHARRTRTGDARHPLAIGPRRHLPAKNANAFAVSASKASPSKANPGCDFKTTSGSGGA